MNNDPTNNGGRTDMYDVPAGADTLNDLIEWKHMPFWRGEAFKALYALEERARRAADANSSEVRELNKVIYYCQRRLKMLEKENPLNDIQLVHKHKLYKDDAGTLQLCVLCEEPTGRCEDDTIYIEDHEKPLGPVCEQCVKERKTF